MKARFRIYFSGNWIVGIAKNDEAKELNKGKPCFLMPNNNPPQSPEDRKREIATILQRTDALCGILKPLESYYPYKK